VAGHVLRDRWVYLPTNFQVSANVDKLKAILSRAKAAGYNGGVISDAKVLRLHWGTLPPADFSNLLCVVGPPRALGLKLIPATADFGYSEKVLWHDPNLAEGLPVRDATFMAIDGRLVPYEAEPVTFANGDFEQQPASGHRFPGWDFQDQPGQATFVDRE